MEERSKNKGMIYKVKLEEESDRKGRKRKEKN